MWRWRRVAVQTISKAVIYHGAGFQLCANARVRVQQPLQICLGSRSKAKSVTNNLPILSVLPVGIFLINGLGIIGILVQLSPNDYRRCPEIQQLSHIFLQLVL